MTSLILPAYSLDLGSQRFTEQAIEISVTLALAPLVDCLTVTFPAAVSLSAAPGDRAVLTLANGENDGPVFAGTIEAIHHSFDLTRVRALNSGGVLARVRPAVTYEKVTAGDVVKGLCDEAGVTAGDVENGVLGIELRKGFEGPTRERAAQGLQRCGGGVGSRRAHSSLPAPTFAATRSSSAPSGCR